MTFKQEITLSQILKAYFFCTFLGYDLYFFPRFVVLFWGHEPVATLVRWVRQLHNRNRKYF